MLITLLLLYCAMRVAALYARCQSLPEPTDLVVINALPDRIWGVKTPEMSKKAVTLFMSLWRSVFFVVLVGSALVTGLCIIGAIFVSKDNGKIWFVLIEVANDALQIFLLHQMQEWVEANWWVNVPTNRHMELLINGTRDPQLIIGEGTFPWPFWGKIYDGITVDTSVLPKQYDVYGIFGADSTQHEKDQGVGELYATISFNATRLPGNIHAATSNPNAEAALENAVQTSTHSVCGRYGREDLRSGKFQDEKLAEAIYNELAQAAAVTGWHISPPRMNPKKLPTQQGVMKVGIEQINWASEKLRQASELKRVANYQKDGMDVTEAGLRQNAINRVKAMGFKPGTVAYQRALQTELRAMEEVFLGIRFAETGAGNVRISGTGGLPTLTVLPQRVSAPKQPAGGAATQPRGKKTI